MKLKDLEGYVCKHSEIKEVYPNNCTLNQIIKCLGDIIL